jgi:hypothetical protein
MAPLNAPLKDIAQCCEKGVATPHGSRAVMEEQENTAFSY